MTTSKPADRAAAARWEQRYRNQGLATPDGWLPGWQARLPAPGAALDLGCGDGGETELLAAWGWAVTAVDLSAQALERSQRRTPAARHLRLDLRDLGPLRTGEFDLVVAHLSLHYFDHADSRKAWQEAARVLRPGGLLLGCVNADDDWHYGAPPDSSGWAPVLVDGVPKQFFDRAKLLALFDTPHWTLLQLDKSRTERYGAPKSCWEFLARRETA
ncbi:class I SAM-dependent methyltransferase [Pelomonas sp. CA6]|uniref:class I SAM-dependent methyltransferase n=1 Tax=Pelomonas sp. CA6 TaxID=2907999 RepID=UPI001F4BE47B|nr:class I SAM-dependent methyltransferase [Pelomonas sp. CA6]MCH7344958.1 class I SAM-dependent methyltransferase [Pelomonas sp. CA6]